MPVACALAAIVSNTFLEGFWDDFAESGSRRQALYNGWSPIQTNIYFRKYTNANGGFMSEKFKERLSR